MKEEVLRIMKMVEEGKITSEKAAELIEAINTNKLPEKFVQTTTSNDNMFLKIRVKSNSDDNVNVQLPIKFIKGILSACGKLPMNINGVEGIDFNMLSQAIDSGMVGKIVDIKSANGDIVEVVIE